MMARHVLFAEAVAVALLAASAVTGTATAAPVHCPKGYKCIPMSEWNAYYQSQAPTAATTNQQATNNSNNGNYIKPESGLSHPNGVGW